MPAVQELPEIQVTSKTQTPEKIAEVLQSVGYDVTMAEAPAVQATPDEVAAQEAAAETERLETERVAEEARIETEEAEKKSRNQRRRDAAEKARTDLAAATDKANRLETELADLRQAQQKTNAQIEELRKNPPKAPVEEPLPEAPKRPARADFLDSEDPETAYEDALLEYGDARRDHAALIAERNKPKPVAEPEKVAPVAAPAAAAAQPTLDQIIEQEKNPVQKRFLQSVNEIVKTEPAALKLIGDNAGNFSAGMFSAIHVFDNPGRIALYLAKNPEEAKRIKTLTDGPIEENPARIRIATKELEKIEQLATEEDAAAATPVGSGDEATPAGDPNEEDLSAARISTQPQRPAAAAPPAKPAAPATPRKHTPVDPVGARGGAQSQKRYEDMTAAEQRALSIDEVRKARGML